MDLQSSPRLILDLIMHISGTETCIIKEVVGVEIFFDEFGDFCILQSPFV